MYKWHASRDVHVRCIYTLNIYGFGVKQYIHMHIARKYVHTVHVHNETYSRLLDRYAWYVCLRDVRTFLYYVHTSTYTTHLYIIDSSNMPSLDA